MKNLHQSLADEMPKAAPIRLVDYPFALRHRTDTIFAHFKLPVPLTANDVERIHQFLLTLVQEEEEAS